MYGTLYTSSEDYDYDYNVIHYDAIDEPAKQCLFPLINTPQLNI